ncbi:hypothetical protein L3Q82_013582 [Scortum barcoo]|uniref:Uncharacterized protein n=1 Tax=Scortum barcoo TaxID=214431 RepID=A0ACB8W184_9TELE|nr:hypothetical protein L3Q82_013582 [Scortum barcoo]
MQSESCQSVWWSGLSAHISQLVENCDTCSQQRAEHREPLLTTPVQERPWQKVGTNLFFWEKQTYLLVVDYYSRFIEVANLHIATASTVIAALKDTFGHHGIPESVVSDNGPQYSCKLFRDFSTEYGFTHITSSPRYPQANGEAERAVATVKGLWKGEGTKKNSSGQRRINDATATCATEPAHCHRCSLANMFGFQERKSKEQSYNRQHRPYIIHTDEGQVRRNRKHLRLLDQSREQKNSINVQL